LKIVSQQNCENARGFLKSAIAADSNPLICL